ncbi:autorepressor SdpR family transcription factor [Bowmanella sp. JS7-9]|uniref:Autorepressor SdpR family transcription factor n=1 Tax=Pseudobowmanella zhangzhouensis TaxID=1537679 RepID=A0ABW1XNP1_9ALTE|nr:autorepressor SdpR family transcription factor [Bowmanella sp. JS7-9]TBX24418.1 ArsR family transcriptional regulator [Bowmanella sp. JS7-9]
MNDVYRALSDPTRRKILELLKVREKSAGELADHFDMSKPAMSKHFTVLKSADLVYSRREGNQIYYGLNLSVLQEALMGLMQAFDLGKSGSKDSENS